MPQGAEIDPIAHMPLARYCPRSVAECVIVDQSITPVMRFEALHVTDMLLSGVNTTQWSDHANDKIGHNLHTLRQVIARNAQEKHVDLELVARGEKGHRLTDQLERYFCTLHWQATELTLGNMRLVPSVFLTQVPGVVLLNMQEAENVFQAGLLGLYEAALRFDPVEDEAVGVKANRFSSYAVPSIRGLMSREVRHQIGPAPDKALGVYVRYQKGLRYYQDQRHYPISHTDLVCALQQQDKQGSWPDPDELQAAVSAIQENDDSRRKLRARSYVTAKLIAFLSPLSFDEPRRTTIRDSRTGELITDEFFLPDEVIADPAVKGPEDVVALRQQSAALWEALEKIAQKRSPRGAKATVLRYGLDGGPDRTFEEVGRQLGVTRERAREMINETLWILGNSTSIKRFYLIDQADS